MFSVFSRITNSKRQFEQAIIEGSSSQRDIANWRTAISNTLDAIQKVLNTYNVTTTANSAEPPLP
jgi:hypothetical protein